jgi:glycosyltransferase involved in cell wall biosynthesis
VGQAFDAAGRIRVVSGLVGASLSAMARDPLRILFAAPVWWPSRAFGGPVTAARELVRRLADRGHTIDVVTSTIENLHERPARRSSTRTADGATVTYLGTPLRYRWMGITPTLFRALERRPRPDVVHVFGFRDPVTTGTAAWCRVRGVPYVFEPLGMFHPRLRKVLLKRVLDATLYRGVAGGAAAVIVASELERGGVVAAGIPFSRVHVRGNGFPSPPSLGAHRPLRERLAIPASAPIVLYVGRIASGKGIEHLVEAARRLPDAHVVLAGPDDRHGTSNAVERGRVDTGGRIHLLPPTPDPPVELYPEAEVFVLASAGESFGMVAAEAAAAGTPVIVSDRCGIAASFRDGEAIVVPYEREAVIAAIRRVLSDSGLRAALAAGAVAAARRTSWDSVTDVQEALYRAVASRTADAKLSIDGS